MQVTDRLDGTVNLALLDSVADTLEKHRDGKSNGKVECCLPYCLVLC